MVIAAGAYDDVVLSADEFVAAWAAHERQAACLALAARRLELTGEWAADGSVSMAAWLRHRCRMSNRDAAALVHRGRFLDTFSDDRRSSVHGCVVGGSGHRARRCRARRRWSR